jgi:hypothetical protein
MRADIHDESGATMSSSQRPDTLMQDRICQIDENLLHRTAGPYIGSLPQHVTAPHQHAHKRWMIWSRAASIPTPFGYVYRSKRPTHIGITVARKPSPLAPNHLI